MGLNDGEIHTESDPDTIRLELFGLKFYIRHDAPKFFFADATDQGELIYFQVEPTRVETEKSKKELIEANEYLGYHYFSKKDYAQSKPCWLKVKELDPNNVKAKKALEDKNMQ